MIVGESSYSYGNEASDQTAHVNLVKLVVKLMDQTDTYDCHHFFESLAKRPQEHKK